jgi:DNA-binding MarR family transcriptional regulator
MGETSDFELTNFLPYLLQRAAEVSSLSFQEHYKARYGMLRTEWRVLFHLGRYGDLTARNICDRAGLHKTKVSRAVHALQDKRYVSRTTLEQDRRNAVLSLTRSGRATYADLYVEAQKFDQQMMAQLKPNDQATLRRCLRAIAGTSEET